MFEQYKLPYAYDALEPTIDALTMETHHSKHHATYTATFNTFAEKAGVVGQPVEEVLANLDKIQDEAVRKGLRNNGGGYYNHNLYFSIMSPDGGGEPTGLLKEKMDAAFGNFDSFKEQITALATGQFGSGWAWMSVTPAGELVLSNSGNQDNPISLGTGNTPIFALDVWEHAYYLKFKNLRGEYIKEFFKVVDWKKVEELYKAAVN